MEERNPKREAALKIILFIVIILFLGITGLPALNTYLSDSHYKFDVTVVVKRTFDGNPRNYQPPVMECEIIEIDRDSYQKKHVTDNEPKLGDIIYISELHDDYISPQTKLSFTLDVKYNMEITDKEYRIASKPMSVKQEEYEKERSNYQPKKYNDSNYASRASITDAIGKFMLDYKDMIPDDQEEQIEEYLEQKYMETGIRMYIIFYDTDDTSYITSHTDEILQSAYSSALSYVRNASDNSWYVRWSLQESQAGPIEQNYEQIANGYLIYGNYYERIKKVIDTAYSYLE